MILVSLDVNVIRVRLSFVLADGLRVPDPASRYQPDDVHGASQLWDAASYAWQVPWSGRPWRDAVIYELHVGTFSAAGTFRGAIAHLDELAELGIDYRRCFHMENYVTVRNLPNIRQTRIFLDGHFSVQDESAGLVGRLAEAHARSGALATLTVQQRRSLLGLKPGEKGAVSTSIKEGGVQIEYRDQDPRVHRMFVAELAKVGIVPRMDQYAPAGSNSDRASS